MSSIAELNRIAAQLEQAASGIAEYDAALTALTDAANEVGRAFSGSWLGYHSRVYYAGLRSPPAGANFSKEWGLKGEVWLGLGSTGDWEEFTFNEVRGAIEAQAGHPNLAPAMAAAARANKALGDAQFEIISILQSELSAHPDVFLEKLKASIEGLETLSTSAIIGRWRPRGQFMTRDSLALSQGSQVPPHISILADVASVGSAFDLCERAAAICKKSAAHLGRMTKQAAAEARVGTNVFIGHGRSLAWRELKDLVKDRLSLPYDEFNRVPVAGITNIARLSEMLDAAAVAFVIMTAEDEKADGKIQARMNVIHEVGLFQGRLGFTKAIVLLEEGCEQFTNIEGLGQIRFPKGKISACFEEVRQVLEREGLVEG